MSHDHGMIGWSGVCVLSANSKANKFISELIVFQRLDMSLHRLREQFKCYRPAAATNIPCGDGVG